MKIGRVKRNCEICGKEFIQRDCRQNTCSQKCYRRMRGEKEKKGKVKSKCYICGVEMWILDRAYNRQMKCFSKECDLAHRRHYRRMQGKWKGECVICGTFFEKTFDNHLSGSKTCSLKCSKELLKRRRKRAVSYTHLTLPTIYSV